MSPSDLLRETGLSVSMRQFRRYMQNGIVEGVVQTKGGHYKVVGPVTPKRIETIKRRIQKFRNKPGRKKLKNLPPIQSDQTSLSATDCGFLNLPGIVMNFNLWMRRCATFEEWPFKMKFAVLQELLAPAAVALRLAQELQKNIPVWDGTKVHFQKIFHTHLK